MSSGCSLIKTGTEQQWDPEGLWMLGKARLATPECGMSMGYELRELHQSPGWCVLGYSVLEGSHMVFSSQVYAIVSSSFHDSPRLCFHLQFKKKNVSLVGVGEGGDWGLGLGCMCSHALPPRMVIFAAWKLGPLLSYLQNRGWKRKIKDFEGTFPALTLAYLLLNLPPPH